MYCHARLTQCATASLQRHRSCSASQRSARLISALRASPSFVRACARSKANSCSNASSSCGAGGRAQRHTRRSVLCAHRPRQRETARLGGSRRSRQRRPLCAGCFGVQRVPCGAQCQIVRVSRVRQAMHARGGRTKQRRGATGRAHYAEDADGKDGDGTDAGSQEPSCSREAERRSVSRRVAQGAQPPPYLSRLKSQASPLPPPRRLSVRHLRRTRRRRVHVSAHSSWRSGPVRRECVCSSTGRAAHLALKTLAGARTRAAGAPNATS